MFRTSLAKDGRYAMTPQRWNDLLVIYTWIYLSVLQNLEGLSWSTFNGKQYMNIDGTTSWNKEESQELCKKKGGFLPKPMNEEENNYLKDLTVSNFFIGINDVTTKGRWVYDGDETPLQWTGWVGAEPDGEGWGEDCVIIAWWGQGHGWYDVKCRGHRTSTVICERKAPVCGKRSRMCHDRQQCVHEMAVCDGRRDCPDASDERGCEPPHCPSGWTPCADGWQCMFLGWKCDGHRNCRDGSDEPGDEVCKQHTCIEGYRKCADQTRCLPEHKFCDGRVDCLDGSDERKIEPEKNCHSAVVETTSVPIYCLW